MVSSTALRTLRVQSGTCGYRTLYSILASSDGGAGSYRRLYKWYVSKGNTTEQAYTNTTGISSGSLNNQYNNKYNNNNTNFNFQNNNYYQNNNKFNSQR